MAIVEVCDGCGTPLDPAAERVPRGRVRQATYCASCDASVVAYLQLVDDLHSDLAAQWQNELAELRKAWHTEHPDGRLPDE